MARLVTILRSPLTTFGVVTITFTVAHKPLDRILMVLASFLSDHPWILNVAVIFLLGITIVAFVRRSVDESRKSSGDAVRIQIFGVAFNLNLRWPRHNLARRGLSRATLADTMAAEYERRLAKAGFLLIGALVLTSGVARIMPEPGLTFTATVVAMLYVLASARQAILRWRIDNHFFGNGEHEIRLLLIHLLNDDRGSYHDHTGRPIVPFNTSSQTRQPSAVIAPGQVPA